MNLKTVNDMALTYWNVKTIFKAALYIKIGRGERKVTYVSKIMLLKNVLNVKMRYNSTPW